MRTAEPNEPDILAAVLTALLTSGATLVEDGRSNDGALAGCETLDIFADFFDRAAEFVAHRYGRRLACNRVLVLWD